MWALFFNCPLKNMFHGVHIFQQSIKKYVPMGSNLFTEGPYISTLCLKNQFRGSKFFSKISSRGSIFGGSIFYVTGPSISPLSTALLDTGIQPPAGSCWTQTHTIQVYFIRQEVENLGHILTPNGLKPNPECMTAVTNFPIRWLIWAWCDSLHRPHVSEGSAWDT